MLGDEIELWVLIRFQGLIGEPELRCQNINLWPVLWAISPQLLFGR